MLRERATSVQVGDISIIICVDLQFLILHVQNAHSCSLHVCIIMCTKVNQIGFLCRRTVNS